MAKRGAADKTDKAKKPMVCKAPGCGEIITWGQRSAPGGMVWTAIGPMHGTCNAALQARNRSAMEQARREGRYGPPHFVCAWCHEEKREAIFHHNPQNSREPVCLGCCVRVGLVDKHGRQVTADPIDVDELKA
jgi:hypothetical protein